MKKLFVFFTVLVISYACHGSGTIALRNHFEIACSSENHARLLLVSISDYNIPLNLKEGYSAALQAVLSKYLFNPFEKYRKCKTGCAKLDQAVASSPASLEIRFLRLMIESNLPAFLRMSVHIDEDRRIIHALIKNSTDTDLIRRIEIFFNAKRLSIKEM
jgi:hypothetical protein